MKYVLKPIEVEAFRLGYDESPGWFKTACFYSVSYPTNPPEFCYVMLPPSGLIEDGERKAFHGDWIVKRNISYSVVSDSAFHKMYEPKE